MKQLAIMVAALCWSLSAIAIAEDESARSEQFLRYLYDRADLIIDATILENVEGGIGSGPLPEPQAQIRIIELLPRIAVNSTIKGTIVDHRSFPIAVSIRYSDRESPSFFRKGDRYIFFLEDRLKREPESHLAMNGEVIKFRTFDPWFTHLPSNSALPLLFSKWKAAAPEAATVQHGQ